MHLSPNSSFFHHRGPSWNAQSIQDPYWIERVTLSPRPDEEDHLLSRHQFDIHLGGPMAVTFYQDGKRTSRIVQSGDLNWTSAGDSCRATWDEPKKGGFVTFSRRFLQQTADAADLRRLPDQAVFNPGDPLTRELVLALVRHGSSDAVYAQSLATSLVLHMLKVANNKPPSSDALGSATKLSQNQLRRVLDYVEDRLGHSIDLESWAKEARFSPWHFARLFKQTTGMAPHRFVQLRRVERAKSLLTTTDTPLSTLAYDLGFSNQSHFTRVFRQFARTTPGKWRSSMNS